MSTEETKSKSNWEWYYETVCLLAKSQGFYSRLLDDLLLMSSDEQEKLKDSINNMEHKFKDNLDVVLWAEQ